MAENEKKQAFIDSSFEQNGTALGVSLIKALQEWGEERFGSPVVDAGLVLFGFHVALTRTLDRTSSDRRRDHVKMFCDALDRYLRSQSS